MKWEKKLPTLFAVVMMVAAAILLLPGAGWAANVTVQCDGGGAPDFTSIQAALNSFDLVGPNVITVTGTCTGNVRIFGRDRVTIQAAVGDTATIIGTGGNVVTIRRSRIIFLRRLIIHGGGTDVVVDRASLAEIRGITIENNTGTGLSVQENSTASLGGSSAEDFVQISYNGGSGIASGRESVLRIRGSTTVENNEGGGVSIGAGRAGFAGENTIRNNGGIGVSVLNGGAAAFAGSNIIEGNPLGMNVAGSAVVNFRGKIRNNGSFGLTGRFRGGVRIGTVSRIAFLGGAEITDNIGPGLLVEFNAAVALSDTSIMNNTEDGLRVVRGSVAFIGSAGGISIAGNGGANISCDSTALLAAEDLTDLAGIGKINCMRIERVQGPPRPGHINEQ